MQSARARGVESTSIAAPYAVSGAVWALVASAAAVLVTLDLALGLGAGVPWLGVGRLVAVMRHTALLGAVSLPIAGYVVSSVSSEAPSPSVARWARWGFILWSGGLLVGVVGILAGYMSPSVWMPAPAPATALMLLGAAAWSAALWLSATQCKPRPPVAAWFGLAAAVGLLVYLGLGLLATTGLHGTGQALAGALSGRGLAGMWAATAAMGVAAALFPVSARRPLYGRRVLIAGMWAWLCCQALAAPRDLAPELLPGWLLVPTAIATALAALAAALLAVALFGAFVGSTEAEVPRDPPTLFIAAGVAILLIEALARAALVPSTGRVVQFTAWDPATGLLPAFAALTLVAIGASYAVLPPRVRRRGTVAPMAHLGLALAASLLLLVPLWPIGIAEAAAGPGAEMLRLRAVASAPGVLLLLVSGAVWALNIAGAYRDRSAAPTQTRIVTAGPGPSAAALVGTTATLVVIALFVTLFLPLVDSSYVGATERSSARQMEPGRLPELGRRQYVSDGCVVCHTQRVRPYPEDVAYGPVTRMGDYADGPPLAGVRRAGPDLAWVGDRYPDRARVTDGLRVHGPGGVPAFPWLIGNGNAPTRDGAAVIDYLLRLQSGAVAAPATTGQR